MTTDNAKTPRVAGAAADTAANTIVALPIEWIKRDRDQARTHFDVERAFSRAVFSASASSCKPALDAAETATSIDAFSPECLAAAMVRRRRAWRRSRF